MSEIHTSANHPAQSRDPSGQADRPRLSPEETARLGEFARACKAAARAVGLYPGAHPATVATLARIAEMTSLARTPSPLKLTVLPDALLSEGRAPARPDQAIGELAALLHGHHVGELTIHPGGDTDAWRRFLSLLARTPDSVRTDGGIAILWMKMGGRHVELREIDYADVLRERSGGLPASWDLIISSCLEGDTRELNDETIRALADLAEDPTRLARLVGEVDDRAAATVGLPVRTAALISMLRGIVHAVTTTDAGKLDDVKHNMATALGQLSPDVMLELLARRLGTDEKDAGTPTIVDEVLGEMSDEAIAAFVAKSIAKNGAASNLLVQAFQGLVPDEPRQRDVLSLAHDETASSPLGQSQAFESLWAKVSATLMLHTYSASLPSDYALELASASIQTGEVERIADDPPQRISAWLGTVAPGAVRALDLQLLKDLLDIEQDPHLWSELLGPVGALVVDLLLVGDFDVADELLSVVVREAGPSGVPHRRAAAAAALERLADGPVMRHIVSHLATIDDRQFERVKSICTSIGAKLVGPLAEALSTERGVSARERLTQLLIAFGPTGRQTVERLKSSPNSAVRRTAIYLLREFGGTDALPDLTALLGDSEPQVQREAVRAIVNIGTNRSYEVLEQALVRGTDQSRDTIMQAIGLVRDERATGLLVHILRHVDRRGALQTVALRAIESLGALRDAEGVDALKDVLYRGDWWAPRRTALFREAAATALARIGTTHAVDVLREAAESAPRGVRTAAAPALSRASRQDRR